MSKLSPEIQASIIQIAGNWAQTKALLLNKTTRQLSKLDTIEYSQTLNQSFDAAFQSTYNALIEFIIT